MQREVTLLILGFMTCLAHPGTPFDSLSQNGFSNREFSRGTNSQGAFINRPSSLPNIALRTTNARLSDRPSLFEMPSEANALLPKFSSSPRNTNPTVARERNSLVTASLFERPNEANSLLPQLPSVARVQAATPQIGSTFTGASLQRPVHSANRNVFQNQGPLPLPASKTSSLPRPQSGSALIRANPALPGSSVHQSNSNQRQVMPVRPRTSNPVASQRESMLNRVNPQLPQFPVHASNINTFQNQRQTALPTFQPSSSVISQPRPVMIGATQQLPVLPLRPTNQNSFQAPRHSSTNFQTSSRTTSQFPELPAHSVNRNAFQNKAPVMPLTFQASRPAASPQVPNHPRFSQSHIPGSIVILGYAGEIENSSSESQEDY